MKPRQPDHDRLCFDPSDPFYPSDRDLEKLIAYEMSHAPTKRISPQDPFEGRPDRASVILQEAVGTREMVTSDQIPAEMNHDELQAIGVKIIGPSKGDPLFVDVVLPEGWKKVPCRDDSRTTHLVDDKDNRRAYMWYKAASYDRKAYGGVRRRYEIRVRHFDDYTTSVAWVVDQKDPDRVRSVFQTADRVHASDRECLDPENEKSLRAECEAWLAANLPDWKSCAAYWDDPGPSAAGLIPPWEQRTRRTKKPLIPKQGTK